MPLIDPEELAFHLALDAEINRSMPCAKDTFDVQGLLVFADWLAERGDKREEGYRAMAAHGVRPFCTVSNFPYRWYEKPRWNDKLAVYRADLRSDLPLGWYSALLENGSHTTRGTHTELYFTSSKEARDQAALAWLLCSERSRKDFWRKYHKSQNNIPAAAAKGGEL